MLRHKWSWIWLIIVVIYFNVTPAWGETPPKERQKVYSLTLFDGQNYVFTMAHQQTKTIYLLAEANHLFSPTETLVYYWPITDEYLADWTVLNRKLTGRLEVKSDTKTFSFEPVNYSLKVDSGSETYQLIRGQAAEAEYRRYSREVEQYLERSQLYSSQEAEYERAYRQFMEDPNGKKAPRPPVEPQPIPYRVTEPQQAFVINLPAGTYQCHLVDGEGRRVPGTSKKIIAFSNRRAGIGYEIIPEQKWTNSVATFKPEETLYIASNSAPFYLNAYRSYEYNELEYDRLHNLQRKGSTGASRDNWTWVKGEPLSGYDLELVEDGHPVRRFKPLPFKVVQTPGTALGYEVEPFKPDPEFPEIGPSFTAYPVEYAFRPGAAYRLQLVDASGKALAYSTRSITLVRKAHFQNTLVFLSLLPLALMIGWRIVRLRRIQAKFKN